MRLSEHDAGFTLIELLVTITLLGVLTVPLANLIIGELHNSQVVADRFALSHDAQISAAYFAQDVAAAGLRDYANVQLATGTVPFLPSIQLNAAANAGGYTCGSQTAVLRFLSDDWTSQGTSPQTDIVAYYLLPVGSVDELHRIKCFGPATSPASDVVLAHNVNPNPLSPFVPPTVTCSSTCTGAAGPPAIPVPQQVTLTFAVTRSSVGTTKIVLTGQRRQS